MVFELTNAPATFQKALDVILPSFQWKTCLIYLDDVIAFSNSVEEHLFKVAKILFILKSSHVSLELSKCECFRTTVSYLGHVTKPGKLKLEDRAI